MVTVALRRFTFHPSNTLFTDYNTFHANHQYKHKILFALRANHVI